MKKAKLGTVIVFLFIIGGIGLSDFLMKDRVFSENENRYLADMPKPTWKDIVNGKFQDGFEEYLNDQMVFRDGWITVKTAIQKVCLDTDIGGAYVGKDGYDFEKIVPNSVDDALVEKNTKAVQTYFAYCSKYIDKERLQFMLVPTSGLILKEKLPRNAILFSQEEYIERIGGSVKDYGFLDVSEALAAHSGEEIYYKTDHHWTSLGAFYAYEQWCSRTGHDFAGMDGYEFTTVSDSFRGSLYSKILDFDSAYDEIVRVDAVSDTVSYQVIADGEELGGFYQEEKLNQKDKYAYFFGGNYGMVEITSSRESLEGTAENGNPKKNLLLVKDSFANCFVPLIAGEYDHIYMVDLRYYKGDMSKIISEKAITDVLVLYNISNFISDKNIYKLSFPIERSQS